MTRLPQAFFARDAAIVAHDLIGCALVHKRRVGIIVECEAYEGPTDKASHARFGPTKRTSVMFGPAGVSYVYLCYGIHEMFNIVTGADGDGQAVLIRAVAHPDGSDPAWGRGPGKVTTALGLDRRHDRRDLATGALYVAAHTTPMARAGSRRLVIDVGPRIGVAYAGDDAARPLRFWWRDHPAVSRGPVAGRTVPTRRKR